MPEWKYQPYYCEENAWQLCQAAPFERQPVWVVVITNDERTCPLWNQKACASPARPVFWDYHVVVVTGRGGDARVWDLDTRLGAPVAFETWWRGTFPSLEGFPPELQPSFRLVTKDAYLEKLSSDRSHMVDAEGEWKHQPPEWSRIYDEARGMNLGDFLDLGDDSLGEWLEPEECRARFGES